MSEIVPLMSSSMLTASASATASRADQRTSHSAIVSSTRSASSPTTYGQVVDQVFEQESLKERHQINRNSSNNNNNGNAVRFVDVGMMNLICAFRLCGLTREQIVAFMSYGYRTMETLAYLHPTLLSSSSPPSPSVSLFDELTQHLHGNNNVAAMEPINFNPLQRERVIALAMWAQVQSRNGILRDSSTLTRVNLIKFHRRQMEIKNHINSDNNDRLQSNNIVGTDMTTTTVNTTKKQSKKPNTKKQSKKPNKKKRKAKKTTSVNTMKEQSKTPKKKKSKAKRSRPRPSCSRHLQQKQKQQKQQQQQQHNDSFERSQQRQPPSVGSAVLP